MTIGDRIKARRVQIGLTVDQVADRIGKNRATVYRYESNDIEKFPLDILPPLAEVLNTTPAYLMGWSDSADPEKTKNQAQTEVIPFKPDNRNVLRLAGRDGSYPSHSAMTSPPRIFLLGGFWRYLQTYSPFFAHLHSHFCSFCFISETGVSYLKHKTVTKVGMDFCSAQKPPT